MDLGLRAELAVLGIRAAPPLRRRSGAGPSDDGHWVLDGAPTTVPIVGDTPWALASDGVLTRAGVIVDVDLKAVRRPRFYDRTTAGGVSYEQIARLHGRHVLATTVVQTCVRYGRDTRCRFCTIEESLRSKATTQVKTPEEIAEVALAAVRLDGVRQLVMTTGTSNGADRGARHLARCVAAVHDVLPNLPIQVQTSRRSTWRGSLGCARPARPRPASTSRASTRRSASAGRPARRRWRSSATTRRGPRP